MVIALLSLCLGGEFIFLTLFCQLYFAICHRSKTGGGGPDEIGAVEQRRMMAKDFLVHVRDTIGLENYLQIVSHLKSFKSRSLSIPHLKDSAADLLKDHPELLEQFLEFLPRKFRT